MSSLAKHDISDFMALLAAMESRPATTVEDLEKICRAHGEETKIDHLTMSEAEIQRRLSLPRPVGIMEVVHQGGPHAIKDNLGAQIRVVAHLLDEMFRFGELPPPFYAKRVGVILRKAKRKDLSDRFQAAYERLVPI